METKLTPTYQPDIYKSDFPDFGSRLVLGTSRLGGVWGEVNEQESIDCILYALENNISSFDTAPSYGNAEVYLGKALAQWNKERPFVSTKVGRLKTETAFEARLDFSIQGMSASLMRSLELLQLDYVDLLFLHEPQWVPMNRIDEILELLISFQEAGYTKMLGIGGNPSKLFEPYITSKYFKVISSFTKMDACNLSAFDDILPQTIPKQLFFYAASSLHFGLLGNRFGQFVSDGNIGFEDNISEKDIETAVLVNNLAVKAGMSLAELSHRYLFSIAEASRLVMGARKLDKIIDTISYWNTGTLAKTLYDEITKTILRN